MDVIGLITSFSYDRETGVLRRHDGRVAGSRNSKGYLQTSFRGSRLMNHRIIWAICYGEEPLGAIDHINGDKQDNRIVNLRLATVSQNNAHRPAQGNNQLGVKGVHRTKKGRPFAATIKRDGKTVWLGRFDTEAEA